MILEWSYLEIRCVFLSPDFSAFSVVTSLCTALFLDGQLSGTCGLTTSLVTIETDCSQQVQNRLRTGSEQTQRFLRQEQQKNLPLFSLKWKTYQCSTQDLVFLAIQDMDEIRLVSKNSTIFYGESFPKIFVALPQINMFVLFCKYFFTVKLAKPPKNGPMQSINMFSTYRKLQLFFFTIPTLKISESVLSLF